MQKVIKSMVFLGMTYGYGFFGGALFHLLRFLNIIRVFHYERFPRYQENLVLVANHPSLLEPLLLPALFFPEYIFYPRKLVPWSTPDKRNYWDRWYFFWIKPRAIPVDRGNRLAEMKSLLQMKKVLNSGGRIILFPEGGRTFRGRKFLYSKTRRKIRELKEGIGWLVLKTKALIVPIWVEGTDKVLPNSRFYSRYPFLRFWKRITIKIGKPQRFQSQRFQKIKQVTERITQALLELADEEE